MPQPLSKVNSSAGFHLGINPSAHQPQLALWAMNIMAASSSLEGSVATLFVKMLGTDPEPGTSIYQSLKSSGAQVAAFQGLAKVKLRESPQDHKDVFNVMMKLIRNTRSRRNDIAHGIWGYCQAIPDGILICAPNVFMQMHVNLQETHNRMMEWADEALTRPLPAKPPENLIPEIPKESIYVYYERDFKEIVEEIQRRIWQLEALTTVLAQKPPHRRVDQLFQQLLTQPEIRRKVEAIRRRRKDSPSEPEG